MMTVSYTAKKKQRLATGLRIPGSESRAKRREESELPSKDLSVRHTGRLSLPLVNKDL